MCFRPSAVMGTVEKNVQYGECPTCGQPVAASVGITSGKCPHCENPIPIESTGNITAKQNKKIL